MEEDKRSALLVEDRVLPRYCLSCGMELPPGAAHLAATVCIKDLKAGISALGAQLKEARGLIERSRPMARLVWIMVAEQGGKRLFTEEQLAAVPDKSRIVAELGKEGLEVMAFEAVEEKTMPVDKEA